MLCIKVNMIIFYLGIDKVTLPVYLKLVILKTYSFRNLSFAIHTYIGFKTIIPFLKEEGG